GKAPATPARTPGQAWEAVVAADREYYDREAGDEVAFPVGCPERVFALAGDRVLIGRRSVSRGINPDIDLSGAPEDTGISRAHASQHDWSQLHRRAVLAGQPRVAPTHQAHHDRVEVPAPLGEVVLVAGRPFLVRHLVEDPLLDQCAQPVDQDVAGDPEIGLD